METVQEVLAHVQATLKAPKDKRNEFGGYNYRTAEGMLSSAKGLMPEGAFILLSDVPKDVGGNLVLVSKASITFNGESIETTSFALHAATQKGMVPAQISGSTSSFARKYALGGLLAIDDSEADPDSKDNTPEPIAEKTSAEKCDVLKGLVLKAETPDQLDKFWNGDKAKASIATLEQAHQAELQTAYSDRMGQIAPSQEE